MQYGAVNTHLQMTVTLSVLGDNEATEEVEFIVDTGFSEAVTLTPDVISRLNLQFSRDMTLTLGDGTTRTFGIYNAYVMWHGRPCAVEVISSDSRLFVGMGLLRGSNLNVDAVPGGAVTISELTIAS